MGQGTRSVTVFLYRVIGGLPGVTQGSPRKAEKAGGCVGFRRDTNFRGISQGSPAGRRSKLPGDSFSFAGVCLVTTYSKDSEQLSEFMLILMNEPPPLSAVVASP